MADFETHMRAGFVSHGIVVAAAGLAYLGTAGDALALAAAGVALPFTLLGATVPDLDSTSSKPFRRFRLAATATAMVGAAVAMYLARGRLVALGGAVPLDLAPRFLAGAAFGVVTVGVGQFTYSALRILNPRHRGILHRLPTGFAMAATVTAVVAAIAVPAGLARPALVAGIVGAGFLVGFGSHLFVDGVLFEKETYVGEYVAARIRESRWG